MPCRYILLSSGVDLSSLLSHLPESVAEAASGGGGHLLAAFMANKAISPARYAFTVAATPPIARYLERKGVVDWFKRFSANMKR